MSKSLFAPSYPTTRIWQLSVSLSLGLMLNSFLQLNAFSLSGSSSAVGLFGYWLPIALAYAVAAWPVAPLALTKRLYSMISKKPFTAYVLAAVYLLGNQLPARNFSKFILDLFLIAIWLGSQRIDKGYIKFLMNKPFKETASYIISELTTIFKASVTVFTFTVGAIGFSLAPKYVELYYHNDIGPRDLLWFAVLISYVSLDAFYFICAKPMIIAVRLRTLMTKR